MYRVMIVDDEKYIRKSIKNRIDWEKFGFEVAEEAGNGKEALSILKQVRPELILVDIRMPVMDGLEFISEAKKLLPYTSYVIMSAYNDFSYAKQAIKLGVEEYILKPIEEEALEGILSQVVQNLNKENLRKVLSNDNKSERKEIPFLGAHIIAAAFYMEADEEIGIKLVENVKAVSLNENKNLQVYYIENFSRSDSYVFLINGTDLDDNIGMNILENVWSGFYDIEGTASFSSVMECNCVREAVLQSIALLKGKLFYPERKILPYNLKKWEISVEKQKEIRNRINYAYQYIIRQEYEKVIFELTEITDMILQKEIPIDLLEELINEVLILFRRLPDINTDTTDFNIMFHKLQSKDFLMGYRTDIELKSDLKYMINRILNSIKNSDNKDVIFEIKEFIQNNFSQNLNTAYIAGKYFLNASYLSTLFKEKTGITLTAYIEGIRMERAKQSLTNKDWAITDIAIQTGYSDPNYFSKVFKRYTGMTPRQYRETALQ